MMDADERVAVRLDAGPGRTSRLCRSIVRPKGPGPSGETDTGGSGWPGCQIAVAAGCPRGQPDLGERHEAQRQGRHPRLGESLLGVRSTPSADLVVDRGDRYPANTNRPTQARGGTLDQVAVAVPLDRSEVSARSDGLTTFAVAAIARAPSTARSGPPRSRRSPTVSAAPGAARSFAAGPAARTSSRTSWPWPRSRRTIR